MTIVIVTGLDLGRVRNTRYIMPGYVCLSEFTIAEHDGPIASARVRPYCLIRSTSNVGRPIHIRVCKGVDTLFVDECSVLWT